MLLNVQICEGECFFEATGISCAGCACHASFPEFYPVLQINALDDSLDSINGLCSLTGSEYAQMAPTEQASAVARLTVFARVEPSHKSALVSRLKEQVRASLHAFIQQSD